MPDPVAAEVEALARLDLAALRARWRERFGPPPATQSADLMRLTLAWHLQASARGGFDTSTRRSLAARGRVAPAGHELGVGATLTRDWDGRTLSVEVVEGGFRYEGSTYRSLSAIAHEVTGTRWNGPRFFGLRS